MCLSLGQLDITTDPLNKNGHSIMTDVCHILEEKYYIFYEMIQERGITEEDFFYSIESISCQTVFDSVKGVTDVVYTIKNFNDKYSKYSKILVNFLNGEKYYNNIFESIKYSHIIDLKKVSKKDAQIIVKQLIRDYREDMVF